MKMEKALASVPQGTTLPDNSTVPAASANDEVIAAAVVNEEEEMNETKKIVLLHPHVRVTILPMSLLQSATVMTPWRAAVLEIGIALAA